MGKLERVVFVEDDPDVAELIDIALNTVGNLTAVGYSNGQQAVDEASAHAPQLILLDVMMPQIDGPTTLQKLRETDDLREVPVVFLTAKVEQKEVQKLRDIGAVAVVAKPFDPMTLADHIRSIWDLI